MWHGKEQPPRWIEVRHVADCAIDEALQTNTLAQLVDLVRAFCREAALEAARNKCDKDGHLRREYYGIVMDLLQGGR